MKYFALLLLLSIVTLAATQKIEWKSCENNPSLTITRLVGRPDPPRAGSRFEVTLNGTLSKEIIAGSKGSVVVNFEGFELFKDDNLNICQFGGFITCPQRPGPLNAKYTNTIPAVAPVGVYDGRITMRHTDNSVIACITFKFKMEPSLTEKGVPQEVTIA